MYAILKMKTEKRGETDEQQNESNYDVCARSMRDFLLSSIGHSRCFFVSKRVSTKVQYKKGDI